MLAVRAPHRAHDRRVVVLLALPVDEAGRVKVSHSVRRPGDVFFGKHSDPCVYCGQLATAWEHVIPWVMAVPTLVVRACAECNGLAADFVYDTILHKYHAIQARLRKRYRALVNREAWTLDELRTMSHKMRVMIEAAERESEMIHRRLAWIVPAEVVDAYDAFMLELARKRLQDRRLRR